MECAEIWEQRSPEPEPVPFYLQPLSIDLVREQKDLIETIKRNVDFSPVAVVLDTLNRSLFGSENKDEDMSTYVRAADAIREAFDCAVIIIHHCGHGADRPRGHSALMAAVDAILAVRRDDANQAWDLP